MATYSLVVDSLFHKFHKIPRNLVNSWMCFLL